MAAATTATWNENLQPRAIFDNLPSLSNCEGWGDGGAGVMADYDGVPGSAVRNLVGGFNLVRLAGGVANLFSEMGLGLF